MKAIKYMLLAMLVLPLTGFAQTYTLTLLREPSQGGSVYGAGSYEAGTEHSISASVNSNYNFQGWYDEDSNLISSERGITYIMPEHDVTLTARFRFDPSVPDEPQMPEEPETTYLVQLQSLPSNAGSISTKTYNKTPGSTINVSVSPYSYWTFTEWRDDLGEVVSTSTSFTYTVPERDSKLTAYFTYNPEGPDDPGSFNSWDPFTGELILLRTSTSLQTTCDAIISTDERASVKKIVIADPTYNSNSSNISYIRNYLTAVEIVDLKNTSFVYYNSNSLAIPTLKKLVLPDGTLSFSGSAFSQTDNAALEEIWIYATVPPTSGVNCLDNIPETCVIYVPNESVAAYQEANYWKDHDIRPMISEENAVGPEDLAWNDLSQLHKLPFSYIYSGADSGRIEYMVEEDGVWQTLCSGLRAGDNAEGYALAQFVKTRSLHTVDFRVVDGLTITPLPDKRVALADLGFKSITVAGPNYYDYGNAVEPSLTVPGIEAANYAIAYSNNYHVGRATARIGGIYPYSIGYRSTTFDIHQLPLPGSVEFVDPDVSLIYCNDYIRPEWRFTDVRNESLVKNTDYTYTWNNTSVAGTASLVITGRGQFTGTITYEYEIQKGPVRPEAYTYGFDYPDEEILYDGNRHGFYVYYSPYSYYSGARILEYYDHETGDKLTYAPSETGEYEAWIGFEEGPNTVYTAPECRRVFTIFSMEDSEWEAIQALGADLASHGYTTGWDYSAKINSLRFSGISVKKGWLTEVNLPDKSMTGSFPETLYAFDHLKRINLSGNRLSGTFNSEDNSIPTVEYLDLTNNLFSGDLTELAATFPVATSIKVSGNRLSTVSSPLPESVTTLEYSGQSAGLSADLDFTTGSLDAFYASMPSIACYDHSTRSFVEAPDLWLTTSEYKKVEQLPASSFAMKLTAEGVEKVSDNVLFAGANGAAMHVLVADNTWFDAPFIFLAGDTDFDRLVTVLDLQGVINCIFDELYTEQPFNLTAADVKLGGGVNVFDVASVVQLLMETESEPSLSRRHRISPSDTGKLAYCSNGSLIISSEEPVAAFDITIEGASLPDRMPQLDALGFNYSVRGSRIVAYSLSGAVIPEGMEKIADVADNATVAYAMLANRKAQPITKDASTLTGLIDIEAGLQEDDSEWCNLQGIRISRPAAPGIYIHNNKKIIIR